MRAPIFPSTRVRPIWLFLVCTVLVIIADFAKTNSMYLRNTQTFIYQLFYAIHIQAIIWHFSNLTFLLINIFGCTYMVQVNKSTQHQISRAFCNITLEIEHARWGRVCVRPLQGRVGYVPIKPNAQQCSLTLLCSQGLMGIPDYNIKNVHYTVKT